MQLQLTRALLSHALEVLQAGQCAGGTVDAAVGEILRPAEKQKNLLAVQKPWCDTKRAVVISLQHLEDSWFVCFIKQLFTQLCSHCTALVAFLACKSKAN